MSKVNLNLVLVVIVASIIAIPIVYGAVEPSIIINMDAGQTTKPFLINNENGTEVFSVDTTGTISPTQDSIFFKAVKPVNELVFNSTAQQPDDDFKFTASPNTAYNFYMSLIFQASVFADIEMGWTFPVGTEIEYLSAFGQDNTNNETDLFTLFGNGLTDNDLKGVVMHGFIVTGSNGGLVTMTWAQTGIDSTNATMFAGSSMIVYEP